MFEFEDFGNHSISSSDPTVVGSSETVILFVFGKLKVIKASGVLISNERAPYLDLCIFGYFACIRMSPGTCNKKNRL